MGAFDCLDLNLLESSYYTAHKETIRHRVKVWQKANPGKVRATKERREGRELKGEHYTEQQWVDLQAEWGHICLCCGRPEAAVVVAGLTMRPDHVKPLAHGGSNDISNIQPLCPFDAGRHLHGVQQPQGHQASRLPTCPNDAQR